MANGLKCTDMCRLPDCENQASTLNNEESADEQTQMSKMMRWKMMNIRMTHTH